MTNRFSMPTTLIAEAQRLEATLDRFRVWRKKHAQEEAALIAQLTAHRTKTTEGTPKADELGATLTGICLQLADPDKEST